MKLKCALTTMLVGLAACRFGAAADEQPPIPVPDAPAAEGAAAPAAEPITLFACVEVEDCDNIAPCAEKLIVSVADPCNPCCCRYVEICVPKCGCPKIRCSKCGTRVSYDYGEYEVSIKSKRDVVEINYDD
jgi:hypothetical protein